MAQREQIDRELKGALAIWLLSLLLFISCLVSLALHHFEALWIVFPVAVLLQLAAIMKARRISCRSCSKALGPAIWYGRGMRTGGVIGKTSKDLRYCPGCGAAIDAPARVGGRA